MAALIIQISPSGFMNVVIEADSRRERRLLRVLGHFLSDDLRLLEKKARRLSRLFHAG